MNSANGMLEFIDEIDASSAVELGWFRKVICRVTRQMMVKGQLLGVPGRLCLICRVTRHLGQEKSKFRKESRILHLIPKMIFS